MKSGDWPWPWMCINDIVPGLVICIPNASLSNVVFWGEFSSKTAYLLGNSDRRTDVPAVKENIK